MILLDKIHESGAVTEIGIAVASLYGCNPKEGGGTWVKYFDGTQVRTVVVQQTVVEVYHKVLYSKKGT